MRAPHVGPAGAGPCGYLARVHKPLAPFVCFACRKSFKRAFDLESPRCPDCGGSTIGLDQKFKAPPMKDVKAWRVVEFVVASGFRYQTLHDPSLACQDVGEYPKTMAEAEKFVVRHQSLRVDPSS